MCHKELKSGNNEHMTTLQQQQQQKRDKSCKEMILEGDLELSYEYILH
jgi:hypothetical protein